MAQFYSFDEIRQQVTLQMVLDSYGIKYAKSGVGDEYLAKLRPEDKTPSANFNFAENIFYDYGNANLRGGVFNLVAFLEYNHIGEGGKLSGAIVKSCAELLGERFGLTPRYKKESENEIFGTQKWQPLTDDEYKVIGINPHNWAQNLNIDVSKLSPEEVQKFTAMNLDAAVEEVAQKRRYLYLRGLKATVQPMLFEEKRKYLCTIIKLNAALEENSPLIGEIREEAQKLYQQYMRKYRILRKAIPPMNAEQSARERAEDYNFSVKPFFVGEVDKEIERYRNNESTIQVGTVSDFELKKKAKELKVDIYDYRGVSHAQFNKFLMNYSALEGEKLFPFAAYDNGAEKPVTIRIMTQNVKAVGEMLGKNIAEVADKNEAKAALPDLINPTTKMTVVGERIHIFMFRNGISHAQMAKSLDTDTRRISDALRGKNPIILQKMKDILKIEDTEKRATVIAENYDKRKFTELTEAEKKRVVDKLYVKPSNQDINRTSGVKQTHEQLYNSLVAHNDKYLYGKDLQIFKNPASPVILPSCIHGNTEYNIIARRQPRYITFSKPTDKLFDFLESLHDTSLPHSYIIAGDSGVKVTIPNSYKNEFVRAAVNSGIEFDEKYNKDLVAEAEGYKIELKARKGMSAENKASKPHQAAHTL